MTSTSTLRDGCGKLNREWQVIDLLAAPPGFEPRYADPEANYLGFFPCSSAFPGVYRKSGKLLSFVNVILSAAPLNRAQKL